MKDKITTAQAFEAVKKGDTETLKQFISDAGTKWYEEELNGQKLLDKVLEVRNEKISKVVRMELRKPTEKEAFEAVKNNDIELMKRFIHQRNALGKLVNEDWKLVKEGSGSVKTLFHAAVEAGHVDMAKLLIENGVDVNVGLRSSNINNDMTLKAIHVAAQKGDVEMIKMLKEKGADLNALGSDYHSTALMQAVNNNNKDAVEVLLNLGADPHQRNKTDSLTAYDMATAKGKEAILKMYIERVSINKADLNTALHNAVAQKYAVMVSGEAVKILIEAGADVNQVEYKGEAILHYAVSQGYIDVAKVIIDTNGHVINAQSKNSQQNTVLHIAVRDGHKEIVDKLIAAGANLDIQNNFGDTALHKAAEKGQVEIIKALVAAGANTNIRNDEGKTPIDIIKEAKIDGRDEIIKLMLEQSSKDISYGNVYHNAGVKGVLKFALGKATGSVGDKNPAEFVYDADKGSVGLKFSKTTDTATVENNNQEVKESEKTEVTTESAKSLDTVILESNVQEKEESKDNEVMIDNTTKLSEKSTTIGDHRSPGKEDIKSSELPKESVKIGSHRFSKSDSKAEAVKESKGSGEISR